MPNCKILQAFGCISEKYVLEAMKAPEKKYPNAGRIWAGACMLVLLFSGILAIFHWHPLWSNGSNVACPIGGRMESEAGEMIYLSCTDTTVTVAIRTSAAEACQYTALFPVTKLYGENQYKGDPVSGPYHAVIGEATGPIQALSLSLSVQVDGMPAKAITIPADRQFHTVVIDYSILLKKGYTLGEEWILQDFGYLQLSDNRKREEFP